LVDILADGRILLNEFERNTMLGRGLELSGSGQGKVTAINLGVL
jgi:hypothetical protein